MDLGNANPPRLRSARPIVARTQGSYSLVKERVAAIADLPVFLRALHVRG